MKSLTAALVAICLVLTSACARSGDSKRAQHGEPLERTLIGQLLLPSGIGSRGVEMMISTSGPEGRTQWVRFDEQGRFAHVFRGPLARVTVDAAADVHRIEADGLPEADRAGRVDLGVIDLRDRLTEHRLVVHASKGRPQGDVRVGLWSRPPPVGPYGEPVSLGSAQFPEVVLGGEMAWLLPNEADSIYFLVERPLGEGRGLDWRSGPQQLFGPYTSATIPLQLILD